MIVCVDFLTHSLLYEATYPQNGKVILSADNTKYEKAEFLEIRARQSHIMWGALGNWHLFSKGNDRSSITVINGMLVGNDPPGTSMLSLPNQSRRHCNRPGCHHNISYP
jgi:hypothetical protein